MLLLLCLSLVVWPAMHWQAMVYLFLSLGDSDSELQNFSTHLARFPLVGPFHTSPMLKNPHGFLEPSCITATRKTQHNLCSEMMVTQTLSATPKT